MNDCDGGRVLSEVEVLSDAWLAERRLEPLQRSLLGERTGKFSGECQRGCGVGGEEGERTLDDGVCGLGCKGFDGDGNACRFGVGEAREFWGDGELSGRGKGIQPKGEVGEILREMGAEENVDFVFGEVRRVRCLEKVLDERGWAFGESLHGEGSHRWWCAGEVWRTGVRLEIVE